MSMKLKAVAAGVAMLVAGSANAAILNDSTMDGNGELFINVVFNTPTPATIVLDTNVSANDLVSGAVTSWTSNAAQTTAVKDLLTLSSSLKDFSFDAGARQNNLNVLDQLGLFLTNTDSTLTPPPSSQINTFLGYSTKMSDWLFSVNQVSTLTADGSLVPVNSGVGDWTDGFQGWNGNGNTINWNTTTDTTIDNSLSLYRYFYNPDGSAATQLYGAINIDSTTGVVSYNAASAVSAVPVPAAVWLFGSGLMGMVGVARRRSA